MDLHEAEGVSVSKGQRLGRSRLLKLLEKDDAPQPVDSRAETLTSQVVVQDDVVAVIRDVFEGTSLLSDQGKVSRILAVRTEINESWGQARDAFLSIGRALLDLENVLSKAEYLKLRSGSDRLFPFSDATATQFRQIARAVESGRIPLEKCPGSYGTAYQITLLNDQQLTLAYERGLIRPDVTRKEIASLRKEVMPPANDAARMDLAALREERRRLVRREQQLAQDLHAVRARIEELEELLGFSND
ncbi:hypothetical protein MSKU3_0190 [Komagataeibacter oboediens]|nr:hypothetical protein MSKU3_0190 [Komagataeibacter oboediens]